MIKAAALLIVLPFIAAGAPPQTIERHHKDCQHMVDHAWHQYRMDTPSYGGQSFNSTRHETNRYAVCSAIR